MWGKVSSHLVCVGWGSDSLLSRGLQKPSDCLARENKRTVPAVQSVLLSHTRIRITPPLRHTE